MLINSFAKFSIKKYPPFGFTKGEYCAIIILYPLWCLELSFLIGSRELSSLFVVPILIC
nr:MAG TPA: hypothetical protein [Caudoviricetes sp.]